MNLLNNKHFKAFVKWYGDRMVQIAQLTPQLYALAVIPVSFL